MIRQVVFGACVALALPVQGPSPPKPRPPAEIAMTRLTADAKLPVALESGAVASEDAVWIPQPDSGGVVRIQASDNSVAAAIPAGKRPCANLVAAFESVWTPLCGERALARISVKDRSVSTRLPDFIADDGARIAAGAGSIWILTDRKGVVRRVDPDTNKPVAEIYVAAAPTSIVFADDALWITSTEGHLLTRVNPFSLDTVETIEVGPRPERLAAGEGGVWTLNRGDGSVTRVDPKTNRVAATIAIGESVAGGEIAVGEGSVWISAPGSPIVRIDPRTNHAVQRFTGAGGGAVIVAHGSLWVSAEKQTWRLDPKLVTNMRP